MSKSYQRGGWQCRIYFLFVTPSRANAQMFDELNALLTVRVNGINIEVDKLVLMLLPQSKRMSQAFNTTQRERVEQHIKMEVSYSSVLMKQVWTSVVRV